jgi:hypothetical protein
LNLTVGKIVFIVICTIFISQVQISQGNIIWKFITRLCGRGSMPVTLLHVGRVFLVNKMVLFERITFRIICKILLLAWFFTVRHLDSVTVRHLGLLRICILRHKWGQDEPENILNNFWLLFGNLETIL